MLTNNFYQYLRAQLLGKTINKALRTPSGAEVNAGGNCELKYMFYPFANTNKYINTSSSPDTYGMVFGTGAVPPTPEDYWLSGDVISTLLIVACTVTNDDVEGAVRMTNTITLQNTSATATVVINEMGLVGRMYASSSSSNQYLIDRTVLDTPLVLAPGEQGCIIYTFNWPIVQ